MSYLKKEKRSIYYAKLYHRTKTKERTIFLNVNNLLGKILPLKLVTLRETGLNGLCPKESPCFWQRVGLQREKGDQPISACLPFQLSIFFPYFLIFLFSFLFSSFLNTCFCFVVFPRGYCKDRIWLESKTGMDPGPRSPNNEFIE